jgi:hypothetical protein
VTAAVAVYVLSSQPQPALRLDAQPPATHIAGAYHIHSTRSDGTGTLDDIAAAAHRAGLGFVVLTDHGDATRPPDAPAYRHGVLVIDAVEINTREGHVVALGLEDAAPYPLAGSARDVVEDVHRLGGRAVIAHPDSPRAQLGWRGSNNIPADGIEWLNVDSEWRDEQAPRLMQRAAHSVLRPEEAIASLFARPVRTLQRLDGAARLRPTFTLAALDAHANIGWREQEEPRRRTALMRPTYETMFRTVVQTVVLDEPLSGAADDDARRVLAALLGGRSYSTIRAFAWTSALSFEARQGSTTFPMGSRIAGVAGGTTLHASGPAPGLRLVLMKNDRPLATGQGSVEATVDTALAVYRVEGYLPGHAGVPWLMSNPIVVGNMAGSGAVQQAPAPRQGVAGRRDVAVSDAGWTIEHDPTSEGVSSVEQAVRRFDYRLGAGTPRGQFSALVFASDTDEGVESVTLTARADVPMRVSVQVRLSQGRDTRWRHSVYVDETPRTVSLRLQDFEPADGPTTRRPIVTPIDSLLLVVDTVNTRPGSAGSLWLSDVALHTNRYEN